MILYGTLHIILILRIPQLGMQKYVTIRFFVIIENSFFLLMFNNINCSIVIDIF